MNISPESTRRWGQAGFTGGLLLVAVTVFHPPTTDPNGGREALYEIARSPFWQPVHWLMLVALALFLVGISGGVLAVYKERAAALVSSLLFFTSLGIWLVVMTVEIAMLPKFVATLVVQPDADLRKAGELLYSFGITAAYLAVALMWCGVILLAFELKKEGYAGKNAGLTGVVLGTIGLAGIVLVLAFPSHSLPIMFVTAPPPFLWMLWLTRKMIAR